MSNAATHIDPGAATRRAGSLWRPRASGALFFSSSAVGERERSGSYVLMVVATFVPAALLATVAVPSSGFEQALVGLVEAVPQFLDVVWRLGIGSFVLWCVTVVVAALVRRRRDVLIDAGAAAVVSVALGLFAFYRISGGWPTLSQAATGGSSGAIPLVALVTGVAVSAAASPYLARPSRLLGRCIVWGATVSGVILGSTSPTGGVLALLIGVGSAALVHLALGAGAGRPTIDDVARALEQLDLQCTDLVAAPRQSTGVFVVNGTVVDGVAGDDAGAARPVRVSVYGRDARDTQLLSRIVRSMWYRGAVPMDLTRQQQVEHEGFVTLLAESRGVAVPHVLVAGRTDRNDALIAVTGAGQPIDALDRASIDDEVIESMWRLVASLHAATMAHGSLSPGAFGMHSGAVVLSDLGPITVAASDDQRRTDLAQTLVSTAVLVGVERAVVIATDQIGAAGVESMLPYLQVPALDPPLRKELKAAEFDIDALRSAAAAAADVVVPEIAKLRRISPQTLVSLGLLVLVAFALITSLGDVDPAALWAELSGATTWLVIAAVVVAQLPYFSQAMATRGACPRPIPYGPVAVLQFAVGFVALAVPSTAGRLALDIRFFQRQGIPATSAVSISAIDSFSGFLVQVGLLVLTLVFGLGQVELTFDRPTGGGAENLALVLTIAAVVLVVLVVAAFVLKAIRNRILTRLRPLLAEVRETIGSLRSPAKLAQLFGGNLLNQLLYAAALGVSLRAFGGHLNLATLVVVYVGAALFGGLMPVPGGIGVVEAALMAGLVAAGIDATTATATALLFRAATFYLPPIWGWAALRWLQRQSYL